MHGSCQRFVDTWKTRLDRDPFQQHFDEGVHYHFIFETVNINVEIIRGFKKEQAWETSA
jgi:hypothetical protein